MSGRDPLFHDATFENHYIDVETMDGATFEDKLNAAIAAAKAENLNNPPTLFVRKGEHNIDNDVNFQWVPFICNANLYVESGAKLIWGEMSNQTTSVKINVRAVYTKNGVDIWTPTSANVLIEGANGWRDVYFGNISWLELRADNSTAGQAAFKVQTAYCDIEYGYAARVTIDNQEGGWVNENILRGRILNLTISGDGSYPHNNNHIDGSFEWSTVLLEHCSSTKILGRFEGTSTVTFGANCHNSDVLQTWDEIGAYLSAGPPNFTTVYQGNARMQGNRVGRDRWGTLTQYAAARSVSQSGSTGYSLAAAPDTATPANSPFSAFVKAGDWLKITVDESGGTGGRPYLYFYDETLVNNISLLTNVSGPGFGQGGAGFTAYLVSQSDATDDGWYALQFLTDGFITAGYWQQTVSTAISRVSFEVRGV